MKWFGWLVLSICAAIGGYNYNDLALAQWFLLVVCFVSVWSSKKTLATWASEISSDNLYLLGAAIFGLGAFLTIFIYDETSQVFCKGLVLGLSILGPLVILAQKIDAERRYDPLSDTENHY